MTGAARPGRRLLGHWHGLAIRERRDVPVVIEDRYGRRPTLVTSKLLPVEHWHELIGYSTFGDATRYRLAHCAHRITLKGRSMRRKQTKKKKPTTKEGS